MGVVHPAIRRRRIAWTQVSEKKNNPRTPVHGLGLLFLFAAKGFEQGPFMPFRFVGPPENTGFGESTGCNVRKSFYSIIK
jgi:hypothetical protein